MITPPTKSFFVIHVLGEAAGVVMEQLSPFTAADARESVLVSEDYDQDIQAQVEMDITLNKIREGLSGDVVVEEVHNPLYIPSKPEDIDAVLEGDPSAETFRFVGMDGNPFTLRSVTISLNDEEIVSARVSCHPFDLPTYTEILEQNQGLRYN